MKFDIILSNQYRNTPKTVSDTDIISYMVGQGMGGTPSSILYDGNIHRFSTDGSKRGDDAGWYVAVQYPSGTRVVNFGDFRKQIHGDYISGKGGSLTENERLEIEYEIEQTRRKAREERDRYHDARARDAQREWESLPAATAEHGYLVRKKVLPHGTRIAADGRLVVPLLNDSGEIRSLQFIPAQDGEKKRFLAGAETKGCFWWLGDPDSQRVFLCEGFATAASIHEVTGCCTFIAFSASALATIAKILRDHGKAVTVVADNDDAGRIGSEKCESCSVITIPVAGMDANDYQNATGELSEILPDLSVSPKMVLADTLSVSDLKVSWLIKGWIPADSIGMIFGKSASGKTNIVLDMLLSLSSGKREWHGNRIRRPGNVVYLCGEGFGGVKRRILAWGFHNTTNVFGNFAVYPFSLDLDTAQGVHEIREQINTLGWRPDIIVIDTVNRYMSGDENSAQEARMLLNAVDSLRREYSCSGLYVHHTGNSEEAQKRARGTSAWKGALDYELSVNLLEDQPGVREIEQTKMKDTEILPNVYGMIVGEEIPGAFDEDGEPITGAVFDVIDRPEGITDPKLTEAVNDLFRVYTEKNLKDRHIAKETWVEWLLETGAAKDRKAALEKLKQGKYRMMDKLISSGVLTPEGDGWYIHDTSETHMILGLLEQVK